MDYAEINPTVRAHFRAENKPTLTDKLRTFGHQLLEQAKVHLPSGSLESAPYRKRMSRSFVPHLGQSASFMPVEILLSTEELLAQPLPIRPDDTVEDRIAAA